MADKIKNFGGFRVIDGSAAGFNLSGLTDKTVIYFVRTDAGKEDGFIYFNGKKYGTGKLSSKAVQDKLTELTTKVDEHIANKATVTATARTSGATDNGNITANDSAKWLSGAAIEQIKKYVDSEDVKKMALVGKEIQLQNTAGAVLAKLDATSFIKDGMLESVTLVEDDTKGKVLQFTWNTDGGKKSTPIEVSEFFHEISGDTNTITVTQPASGTTGSLKISAKTVANVSGVTSGATALMTGGITQQYVAQQINGLAHTLNLTGTTQGVTYATATIVQQNGVLTDKGSSLKFHVASGLEGLGGLAYNDETHDLSVTGIEGGNLLDNGLVDGDNLAKLLRNNNKKVVSAFSYLKGQITTLSSKMTTVTGSTYITVTKAESTNEYTVSAATGLTDAITNANSAVQSVNGKKGTAVTINSSDIQLGKTISGHTTTDSVTTVLEDIYNKLSQTSSDALTEVVGSNSINVTAKASGSQTISVKAKPLSETEKAAGQIEIITTGTTGIYGLLYFGGDDVE